MHADPINEGPYLKPWIWCKKKSHNGQECSGLINAALKRCIKCGNQKAAPMFWCPTEYCEEGLINAPTGKCNKCQIEWSWCFKESCGGLINKETQICAQCVNQPTDFSTALDDEKLPTLPNFPKCPTCEQGFIIDRRCNLLCQPPLFQQGFFNHLKRELAEFRMPCWSKQPPRRESIDEKTHPLLSGYSDSASYGALSLNSIASSTPFSSFSASSFSSSSAASSSANPSAHRSPFISTRAQAPIYCMLDGGHRLEAGMNGQVIYRAPDGLNRIHIKDIPTGYGEITSFLPIDKKNYNGHSHFRFLLIGYTSGKVGVIRFHLRGDLAVWDNWRADKKLFADFWQGGGAAVITPHANGKDFVINNNYKQSIPFQNAIRRLVVLPIE